MSKNCIKCVARDRTGTDLLCDECRSLKANCRCASYNKPDLTGTSNRPEVVLPTPPHIAEIIPSGKPNGIGVDACIADAIRMLWSHKVETLGCCCGHGKANPSLVISEPEDAERVKKLLAEHDDRKWEVNQWRLVSC